MGHSSEAMLKQESPSFMEGSSQINKIANQRRNATQAEYDAICLFLEENN